MVSLRVHIKAVVDYIVVVDEWLLDLSLDIHLLLMIASEMKVMCTGGLPENLCGC